MTDTVQVYSTGCTRKKVYYGKGAVSPSSVSLPPWSLPRLSFVSLSSSHLVPLRRILQRARVFPERNLAHSVEGEGREEELQIKHLPRRRLLL